MQSKWQNKFIQVSTRRFLREGQQATDYSFFDMLHGYVYARWPYLYIGIGTGEHRLAKPFAGIVRAVQWFSHLWKNDKTNGVVTANTSEKTTFADSYHGKVVPLESATRLVTVNEDICLPDLEQVIPYKRARAIILENPDHIVALECPCRTARPEPCLPLDVCLIVGEPFAGFVLEHHSHRARQISQAEAVEILHAEDQRGHVHHAFFKDAMLGRFYAICNCCSCCCGAMQAHRNGTPMLASSGYIAQVDEDLCIACGECVEACQFDAVSILELTSEIDSEACMGCGICVNLCEQEALSLQRESTKGIPLDIQALMAEVVPL